MEFSLIERRFGEFRCRESDKSLKDELGSVINPVSHLSYTSGCRFFSENI